MHPGVDLARIAVAKRRVKRAVGSLRDAVADLGQLTDDDAGRVLGVYQPRTAEEVVQTCSALRALHRQHGPVEVVVLRPPRPADAGAGDHTNVRREPERPRQA